MGYENNNKYAPYQYPTRNTSFLQWPEVFVSGSILNPTKTGLRIDLLLAQAIFMVEGKQCQVPEKFSEGCVFIETILGAGTAREMLQEVAIFMHKKSSKEES